MSNFTQLNLQDSNSNKAASTKPAPKKLGLKPEHGGAKVAAIVGSFMAATLIATFTIGTNGCSKSKPPVASNPSITQPVAATPAPIPSPAPVVAKQTKSPRQHKLATFKNKEYAISFRYPTHYTMKEGEETDTTQTAATSAAMNFAQPGGMTLSTIELPEKLYTGTDFDSAFFTVNVNPKMTADECSQFAFPEKTELDNNSDGPSKVNVAGKDYDEMNDVVSDGNVQANARYYHLYQNSVCYEFALGLQTAGDETNKDMKPVNRDKVFDKLQWMLSTVKIKTTDAAPAVAKTTVEPSSTTDNTTTASSTTQVTTPNNQ
jgi:hypothetical protein